MKFIDVPAIGFGGMAVEFDARQRRDKGPLAPTTLKALGVDLEIDLPAKAIEVTHFSHVGPLAVDWQAPCSRLLDSLRSSAEPSGLQQGHTGRAD